MPQEINIHNLGNMVNYTNVLTSAANEIYISSTEAPDSRSYLMRNSITIDFSFAPIKDINHSIPSEQSTSATTAKSMF